MSDMFTQGSGKEERVHFTILSCTELLKTHQMPSSRYGLFGGDSFVGFPGIQSPCRYPRSAECFSRGDGSV
jgi:hypothetical protein